MQLNTTPCKFLRAVCTQKQSRELTHELRLEDTQGDIGRIIAVWGQPVIRAKQWRSGSASVSGGVSVHVLYETDQQDPVMLNTWIPFQCKFEIPQSKQDGFIWVGAPVCATDARTVSARKIFLRSNVEICCKAVVTEQTDFVDVPEETQNLQLLRKTYPLMIPEEFGEKEITLEEPLQLQDANILLCQLLPVITHSRIAGDRMVFKGEMHCSVLYESGGEIQQSEKTIEFSQFADLDKEYSTAAQAEIEPVLTYADIRTEDTNYYLSVGLAVQYEISQRQILRVTEDAYSTCCQINTERSSNSLPVILDSFDQEIELTHTMPLKADQILYANINPGSHTVRALDEGCEVCVPFEVQVLYNDSDHGICLRCEQDQLQFCIPSARDVCVDLIACGCEQTAYQITGDGVEMRRKFSCRVHVSATQEIPMITSISVGEQITPDESRPSWILRRWDKGNLWELAKEYGSGCDEIRQINSLASDEATGELILIPVI